MMKFAEKKLIRVAILDLYEGVANQGMRCIREILNQYGEANFLDMEWDEFDVRQKLEVPDNSYDIYISSGGPGSPLESKGSPWENAYFHWLGQVEAWNNNTANQQKKYVFHLPFVPAGMPPLPACRGEQKKINGIRRISRSFTK